MILLLALIAFLLFGGLGFVLHALWFGLILAAVLVVVHLVRQDN